MWFWTIETDYEKEMEHDIKFEVSNLWLEKWFLNKRKGTETWGNIEKEFYDTFQDFLDDWILDDTVDIFNDANEDNAIINKRILSEWVYI